MAALLAGSWRTAPPPLDLSEADLADSLGSLWAGGAGGLAWFRLRQTALRNSAAARQLRQIYRDQIVHTVAYEQRLEQLFERMHAVGIQPILIKGWAAARLYPETGLRPYGDIDLCVRPDQLPAAKNVLLDEAGRCGWEELHEGIPDLRDRTWELLFQSARLVRLAETEIRILGAEDELRQLCLHLWRHHGFRPIWLCDIAAALESLPATFDWDYFQSGDPLLSKWAMGFIGLAIRLLGARLDEPIRTLATEQVSWWFADTVLWRWGAGFSPTALSHFIRNPAQLPRAVLHRWLNPIRAAYRARLGPTTPLAWVQLASLLVRPFQVAARVRRVFRKRQETSYPFDLHLQDESVYC
jgi:hypothetical protein